MIHTDEDDEFERIAHEAKIKGQPYYFDPSNNVISTDKNDSRFTPLGQLWPVDIKREWVGLTDEDMNDPRTQNFDFIYGARWAESKLKERNNG